MRHTTFAAASLLLLGGALGSQTADAQQAPTGTITAETPAEPTASVTLVAQPEEAEAAATPASAPTPTASTTLVVPVAVPTTIATGVPTTIATGVPTTVATGVPTTIATGVPTTVATGVPTTIATGVPAAVAPAIPAPPGAVPSVSATTSATATLPPGAQSTTATIPAPATPATGAVIDPATYQKRKEFDNTPWRFNMEQNGQRMTPDDFAAWMEARGVRVAKGPAAHRPANRTTDGLPAPGSAMPVGLDATASTTIVVPAAPAPPTDALAPGSVTPSDAWTGTEPPTTPTSTTTIVVPAEADDPAEGEGAQ